MLFILLTYIRFLGVFIDILVAIWFWFIVVAIALVSLRIYTILFIILTSISFIFLICFISLIGLPLLTKKKMNVIWLNRWWPRHIFGMIVIGLPLIVAYFNLPICTVDTATGKLKCSTFIEIGADNRIGFCYMIVIIIYAHCNFSQLCAWPKTLQAVVVAAVFLAINFFCQQSISNEIELHNFTTTTNCSSSYKTWESAEYATPFFLFELVIDVILAVMLVAFLNYQFETSFRMSFFGDVQARRDTAKMRVVRDQADWLLTNIIPQHAVESLKTDTKYSENHLNTAVMFASITNWNEMYEENFEGGREFLRVLNEVIGDFDELLDREEFCHVEKIKTIGSTYMAASGLNPLKRKKAKNPNEHIFQVSFNAVLYRVTVVLTLCLVNKLKSA